MDREQMEHLQRVSTRIGNAIIEFCRGNLEEEFHADDLREWVSSQVARVAPGSADRIFRDLRIRGRIDYVLVSRRDSLYRVTRVA